MHHDDDLACAFLHADSPAFTVVVLVCTRTVSAAATTFMVDRRFCAIVLRVPPDIFVLTASVAMALLIPRLCLSLGS